MSIQLAILSFCHLNVEYGFDMHIFPHDGSFPYLAMTIHLSVLYALTNEGSCRTRMCGKVNK